MPTLITLLKGVNVSGKKMVPMATFREVLEGLGATEAKTLLQSGNAVFNVSTAKVPSFATKLQAALSKAVGFEVTLVVRTLKEFERVVDELPWALAEGDGGRCVAFFLSEPASKAFLGSLDLKAHAPDEILAKGSHLYARFPNGIGGSKLAVLLNSPKVASVSTGRNWNTVLKLQALARATAENE